MTSLRCVWSPRPHRASTCSGVCGGVVAERISDSLHQTFSSSLAQVTTNRHACSGFTETLRWTLCDGEGR
ncbi:uncharacterized [Lates japonicus]